MVDHLDHALFGARVFSAPRGCPSGLSHVFPSTAAGETLATLVRRWLHKFSARLPREEETHPYRQSMKVLDLRLQVQESRTPPRRLSEAST